ncbi:MAG: oxygenase MpaB family protein [Pseudomonadota bacterium]|nr:oxygenase MpaB family protein [Pseudomonadota bacterium]
MRSKYARQISVLDPVRDYREIVYLLTCYEFPWDIERALEFALFRTYAVPSISRLLDRTGEFARRPRKRYDDTELILAEILENGFDSPRGQAALERMNQMHGRFPIANGDFLYVLSTFVFEPIRWIDRYGWRPLSETERLGFFHYYRELGKRMGIQDIPDDIERFERYNRVFEARRFRYAESNQRIGAATRDLLLGFYLPRFLLPLGRPIAHALMDEKLLRSMGFTPPSRLLRSITSGSLTLHARVLKWIPSRRHPHLLTRVKRPTYPEGYQVAQLGTFHAKSGKDAPDPRGPPR